MSIPNLPVDFKDDILNTEVNQKRKYQQTFNSDGSVSLEDVTVYTQQGSEFGASQVNKTNGAINNIYNERVLDLDELELVTEPGFFVDALAVKELNDKLPEEANGYLKFANGTLIQWGRASFPASGAGGAGYATVDFTIPFVGTPKVTATAEYASSLAVFGVSVQPSESSVTLYARTNSGGIVTGAYAYWTAIGRWK